MVDTCPPPKLPPRTHPIHLRNRLNRMLFEQQNTSPQNEDRGQRSRRASSVGFVEISELLKYENSHHSTATTSTTIRASIRHLFTPSESRQCAKLVDSHINPMFAVNEKSQSFTQLPYPAKKRDKFRLRRVFSCFSTFHN